MNPLKKLTIIGITLTLLFSLTLWQQELAVAAKAESANRPSKRLAPVNPLDVIGQMATQVLRWFGSAAHAALPTKAAALSLTAMEIGRAHV